MKKLSIVLALIMALSCFCFTAFAAEGDGETTTAPAEIETTTAPAENETTDADDETTTKPTTTKPTTTKAEPVTVYVDIIWKDLSGAEVRDYRVELEGFTVGSTIKADTILKTVKARVDASGAKIIDTEEYVVSDVVVLKDPDGMDGSEVESVTLNKNRASYNFIVYVFEINDVENLAQVAATELAGNVDWKGIASANVGLINQVINGAKAAADSLAQADYPEIGEKKTEDAAKKADGEVKGEKVVRTPDTGASAVAGVAVVVLALSATTAVVLRKKED